MSLNRYMHPRNTYKERKPDFKALALKYKEFREHATQDLQGRVHLDFKKPESLRALSWALLKEDFNLDVDIPLDRLIPTVPLRLNYILWLEDILGGERQDVRGIDIGTGASCVYPLLGARKNSWSFLATEVDGYSTDFARKNVHRNGLQESIKVVQVAKDAALCDILQDDAYSDATFEFCMSNPPFFASSLEAWGMQTTRSDKRPEPNSVCTASPVESIYPGGEVQFVKQLIQDSLQLQTRVRIYTTMLGKKSSVPLLREELRKQSITNVGTSEFCQGRTMRWGLAWTFDPTVNFPKPPSKLLKSPKAKAPLVYVVPRQLQLHPGLEYTVTGVSALVKSLLQQLQMELEPEAKTTEIHSWKLTARQNTWSNQRRKRRQQRQQGEPLTKTPRVEDAQDGDTAEETPAPTELAQCSREQTAAAESGLNPKSDDATSASEKASGNGAESVVGGKSNNEKSISEASGKAPESAASSKSVDKTLASKTSQDQTPGTSSETFLFRCNLAVKKDGGAVSVEIQWTEGESKELIHQVLQYIKNTIK